MKTIIDQIEFYLISCYECGVQFAINEKFDSNLRKNHKLFYCPNGHVLSYGK